LEDTLGIKVVVPLLAFIKSSPADDKMRMTQAKMLLACLLLLATGE
jgi:hypothetical protein